MHPIGAATPSLLKSRHLIFSFECCATLAQIFVFFSPFLFIFLQQQASNFAWLHELLHEVSRSPLSDDHILLVDEPQNKYFDSIALNLDHV